MTKKLDKKTLYILYWVEKMDTNQIGELFGCSNVTIGNYMKKYGIKMRTIGESHTKISINKETLYILYWVEILSARKIGEMFGCDGNTIFNCMKKCGIIRRTIGESNSGELNANFGKVVCWKGKKGKLNHNFGKTGKLHPAWRGGLTSKNTLIRTSVKMITVKKLVMKKDNYTCQICLKRGGRLNVHHIFPLAEYQGLAYNENNLTTLCVACHYLVHGKKRRSQ